MLCDAYALRINNGIAFYSQFSPKLNSEFYSGPFERLTKQNSDRITYIKKGIVETDTSYILVIQYENFGLKYDLESDNPSEHFINFQVRFHSNGNVQLIFGEVSLANSEYFSEEHGFLDANKEVTGYPRVGLSAPGNEIGFFHYLGCLLYTSPSPRD